MTNRLFDNIRNTNPNASVMVVSSQEGNDDNDKMCASIGDATMQHIHNLNGFGRQMWEELLLMPSGSLFRMVPSWDENDRDPMNLRGKNLDKFIGRFEGKVCKSELEALKEALQIEESRREKVEESEDALDQECLPYEDWEKFPGHWSKMDIPTTPRDRAIYMGDTKQNFYDEFPEGHPHSSRINQFLAVINRLWEEGLDFEYARWVEQQLDAAPIQPYVRSHLKLLTYNIARNNNKANDYTEKALLAIDKCWATLYKNEVAKKAMQDPMIRLLLKKEQEWKDLTKKGFFVFKAIKRFGQLLFTDFKGQMTGYHWTRYRRVRDKYAPRVVLKGVDINRCGISNLQKALRISKEDAQDVWFARPFSSLEDAYSTGYVNVLSFADDEKTDKVVLFIEKHAQIAYKDKDIKRMGDVCKILLDMHREKKGNLKTGQWSTIWRCYNILKAQVLEEING